MCTASFVCSEKIFFEIKRFDHLNTVAHNVIHRNCAQPLVPASRIIQRFSGRLADAG